MEKPFKQRFKAHLLPRAWVKVMGLNTENSANYTNLFYGVSRGVYTSGFLNQEKWNIVQDCGPCTLRRTLVFAITQPVLAELFREQEVRASKFEDDWMRRFDTTEDMSSLLRLFIVVTLRFYVLNVIVREEGVRNIYGDDAAAFFTKVVGFWLYDFDLDKQHRVSPILIDGKPLPQNTRLFGNVLGYKDFSVLPVTQIKDRLIFMTLPPKGVGEPVRCLTADKQFRDVFNADMCLYLQTLDALANIFKKE